MSDALLSFGTEHACESRHATVARRELPRATRSHAAARRVSHALETLRSAVVDRGILASVAERANYRRIWTRDAVICGLAGVAADDSAVIAGLAASLESLAAAAGPHGEIPSNVAADVSGAPPSYGGLAGRIDCGAWFAIGACAIDSSSLRPAVDRALELYNIWELNARGLVYTPPGGCWADEYPISGYTATEQLLRLWAMRDAGDPAFVELARRIAANYYLDDRDPDSDRYHPRAYERAPRCDHLVSSFSPTGYDVRFDGLANSLAIWLEVGDREQRERAAAAGKRIAAELGGAMVPAFWPAIEVSDELESMAGFEFRNRPGAYHNGGRWPVVNGFWGQALLALGDRAGAEAVLADIRTAGGHEYVDTDGCLGGARTTWSAAAEVLLAAALEGS